MTTKACAAIFSLLPVITSNTAKTDTIFTVLVLNSILINNGYITWQILCFIPCWSIVRGSPRYITQCCKPMKTVSYCCKSLWHTQNTPSRDYTGRQFTPSPKITAKYAGRKPWEKCYILLSLWHCTYYHLRHGSTTVACRAGRKKMLLILSWFATK